MALQILPPLISACGKVATTLIAGGIGTKIADSFSSRTKEQALRQVDELKQENEGLKQENEGLKQENEGLKQENEELNNKTKELENDIVTKEQEYFVSLLKGKMK
ncbi:Hypothetical protein EHI5A_072530 [Entamoeba histolytica KU27]|uniref:Uncharacterized protein n=1 Tax=Entamoeba histolytica KU27 TaxID=885311 RepID=M2R154_ENTHI|nr:Hypothetical protein EHI5A_072530 [Entamoeba histolytica KU27]